MGKDQRYRGLRLYLPDDAPENEGTVFAGDDVYTNSSIMGDHRVHIQPGHQQHSHSGLSLPRDSSNSLFGMSAKFKKRMAEIKLLSYLLTFIALPTWLMGILLNIQTAENSWKATILFILGGIFVSLKIVVYAIKARQDIRMKEYDLQDREKKSNVTNESE